EDKQLWGQQYSRKVTDASSVQQDIATAISGNLRVRLTTEDKSRLAKLSATNPEAYQLYLKGRYHANQSTAAGLKKSIEYFEQAIDIDPGYARSEEHTSELQSPCNLVCRLLLEKKKKKKNKKTERYQNE